MNKIRLFTRDKEKGMSLKKLNYFMVFTALVISALLFIAMRETNTMYDKAHNVTQQLREYEKTSSDLQTASDYLTDQIRLFAITGDKRYLDDYFTEANVTKRRDKALELLKTQHENSPAYNELKDAMDGSLFLMRMEYHAARLAVDAYGYNLSEYPQEIQLVHLFPNEETLSPQQKGELAKEMLFSEEYRKQKRSISRHTTNCLEHLEKEIWDEQAAVSEKLKTTMLIEHVLTICLIAVLLGIVYLTSRLVISPLQNWVKLIRRDAEIPVKGASEIRFIAQTYNSMREENLRRREKLSYEATHDKLTTLYNRRGFEKLLDGLDLSNAAVLLMDLDKFKTVNDTFGHEVGDKVLAKVADTLFEHFKGEGYVCRFGGDEFVVIMENATPSIQEHLKKKIQSINEILTSSEDGIPPISVSVGVTFCNRNMDVKALLRQADDSLYEAKESGRSDIRFNAENEV